VGVQECGGVSDGRKLCAATTQTHRPVSRRFSAEPELNNHSNDSPNPQRLASAQIRCIEMCGGETAHTMSMDDDKHCEDGRSKQ